MRNLTIFLLFILILISGCNPCKRLAKRCPSQDSTAYVEVIKEDPGYSIPDSAYFALEFWCDSTYSVLLRDFEEYTGGLRTELILRDTIIYREDKSRLKLLKMNLSVYTDSIEILNRTIERYKTSQKVLIKEVPLEVKVKHVPRFYKYCLAFSLLVILAIIAYIWLKFKGIRL